MAKLKPVEKFHLTRLSLFVVLGVAVLLTHTSGPLNLSPAYNKQAVLAYATSMNRSDLLAAANASRAANGLAPLTLNAQLNNSAQMKAGDMVTYDYWAHVSPSGVQPWYWFNAAGYSYQAAGENLAYGFDTGSEVNTAWMNSVSHKANLLGDYTDVGFGIASSAQFQGGENTIVVAHYGKPLAATPPPQPPAPVTTTPTPTHSTPTPTTPPQSTAPAPTPAPSSTAPITTPPVSTQTTPTTPTTPETPQAPRGTLTTASPVSVSVLDRLKTNQLPNLVVISLGLTCAAAAFFGLTHRAYVRHLAAHGKKFVLHHPLLDVAVLVATTAFILTKTAGHLL